jgi:hypothetical protein
MDCIRSNRERMVGKTTSVSRWNLVEHFPQERVGKFDRGCVQATTHPYTLVNPTPTTLLYSVRSWSPPQLQVVLAAGLANSFSPPVC